MATDELEQQLIGMACTHWLEVAEHFRPALFADDALRTIAEAIKADADAHPGKGPSGVRVWRLLKGEAADLFRELGSAFDRALFDPEAIALELERRAAQRELDALFARARHEARQDDADPQEIVARVQRDLSAFVTRADQGQVASWDEALLEVHGEIEKARTAGVEAVMPVGLSELQHITGGLRRKESVVVAARPGMGKSALVGHVSTWLGQRRQVRSLVVSLEMPKGAWVGRTICRDIRMDSKRWRNPGEWTGAAYQAVQDGINALMGLPIGFLDRRGLDLEQIAAKARAHKAEYPDLSLLVVDHLGLVEPGAAARKGESTAKVVGRIAKRLRDLADEIDVCLILLAQLNRGVESREDKRPMLSDLRDSGEIEEHADLVLGLYRHSYYEGDDDKRTRDVCEARVLKGRAVGQGDTALMRFDGPHFTFGDLAPHEMAAYREAVRKRK